MLLLFICHVFLGQHIPLEGDKPVLMVGHIVLDHSDLLPDLSHRGFEVLQSVLYRPASLQLVQDAVQLVVGHGHDARRTHKHRTVGEVTR